MDVSFFFIFSYDLDDNAIVSKYVGEDDKIHFVDKAGADTALPFKKANPDLDVREYIGTFSFTMTNDSGNNQRFSIRVYYNNNLIDSGGWIACWDTTVYNFSNYGISGYVRIVPEAGTDNKIVRMGVYIFSTEGLQLCYWGWILTTTTTNNSANVNRICVIYKNVVYLPK